MLSRADIRNLMLSAYVTIVLTGCNLPGNLATTTGGTTDSPPPAPSTTTTPSTSTFSGRLSRPSIIVGQNGSAPSLVYHETDSDPSQGYASLEGCMPGVDEKGNL